MAEKIPVGGKADQAQASRPAGSDTLIPPGAAASVLPPYQQPIPSAMDVAWVCTLPTAAPALSSAEVARAKAVRDGSPDPRIKARAQLTLTANGTP